MQAFRFKVMEQTVSAFELPANSVHESRIGEMVARRETFSSTDRIRRKW
jgi:hypothetical protein